MDGKPHPVRRLHKLRTPLKKKLRASNSRIWRNTETSKSRPMNAEMRLARKSFRNRRTLRRNRTRRTESKNSTETTTELQIRPRVTKQSSRRTLSATTEHLQLQPVIRNTVGHATSIVGEVRSLTSILPVYGDVDASTVDDNVIKEAIPTR